jgi:hydrogenase-1 operon protein HyaE
MPSVLIKKMIELYKYPVLDENNIDEFINSHDECVLFFANNPSRYPESDDVAMILPELVKEYGNRFTAAFVEQKSERTLQRRFGFARWPTMVFLKNGGKLGHISKVQDWNEYIIKINHLLTPKPEPLFDIPMHITSSS